MRNQKHKMQALNMSTETKESYISWAYGHKNNVGRLGQRGVVQTYGDKAQASSKQFQQGTGEKMSDLTKEQELQSKLPNIGRH